MKSYQRISLRNKSICKEDMLIMEQIKVLFSKNGASEEDIVGVGKEKSNK
jgi:hypothetical protein